MGGVKVLKCQVTGPVTFGMQVVDAEKRPIYYDSQLADVLSKMIALRARWCENELKTRTGVKETLVVLNEPYLASLGSSVVPIDKESVKSGLAGYCRAPRRRPWRPLLLEYRLGICDGP